MPFLTVSRTKHFKTCLLFFILFFFPPVLWARDVWITVEDNDLEMPLEGATVRSWDGSDHVCNDEGKALITVPDDRQVTVRVSYPGYETGRLVIPVSGTSFSVGLSLGGTIESKELVIEASRPGSSETKSGRSVAISGEAMERSSQIGLIEDVMTSIKLLPGVGYSGMFNALPSIRGGDPGDLMSSYDGFYITNPYHWGGGFSIFDPHMVSSAQLSHGIFSSRFGHTISGLLEVSSKKATPDYAELELGISTSAVNLNAALPVGSRGGLMLMGKVTYWDPFIWLLQGLSNVWDNERLQMINAITTAPYIRSAAATFNYRFNSDLELTANAFIGTDGVGADYPNEHKEPWVEYSRRALFIWKNLQTFATTGLSFNPRPSMLLKATVGAGYEESNIDGKINYDYLRAYAVNGNGVRTSQEPSYKLGPEHLDMNLLGTQSSANIQGRVDFDWSLGNGFLVAAGIHELYGLKKSEYRGKAFMEVPLTGPFPDPPLPFWVLPPDGLIIKDGEVFYMQIPLGAQVDKTRNEQFNSSGYILTEYKSSENRFGAELGLRVDHHYFKGTNSSINTLPAMNPRINLDFNVFKNRGVIGSLDLTVGTGLFSSMNNALISFNPDNSITSDYELRPNRSWTSVVGANIGFEDGWSFNIEGYFKYVYDRNYQLFTQEPGKEANPILRSDGKGLVWGFDLMLQKFESRYVDGWLSYTFTHARYHEPKEMSEDFTSLEDTNRWYYPYFHRFHSANLVMNIKPSKKFNIYIRFGVASGRPMPKVGEPQEYPVVLVDADHNPVIDPETNTPMVIKKYKRDSEYSDNSRTTWSIPLDLKLSYKLFNPRNKVLTEFYIAAENLASLVYVAQANTTFNSYTGTEDEGGDTANYELPLPMISVGMRWSF